MASSVEGFIDAAFGDARPVSGRASSDVPLIDRVLRGGFPEAVAASAAARRGDWFDSYLTTLLSRDVRDLARIEGLADLPRLVSLIGARPMALLNHAELARSSGLPQTTLKRYLVLLESVFLARTIPPWHGNLGKRLIKTPKVLLTDSGLATRRFHRGLVLYTGTEVAAFGPRLFAVPIAALWYWGAKRAG